MRAEFMRSFRVLAAHIVIEKCAILCERTSSKNMLPTWGTNLIRHAISVTRVLHDSAVWTRVGGESPPQAKTARFLHMKKSTTTTTTGKTSAASSAASIESTPPRVCEVPHDDLADSAADETSSSSLALTSNEPPRRKILCNPSAGDTHRRERGSPWRSDVDEKIRVANAKARDEQQEKRRWGLAKQIQDGLMHTYGKNYGVAELAMLIKEGMVLKMQQQQGKPVDLRPQEVTHVQLLAAAEKYDLKQVVVLLDKFPKGRNAHAKQ